MLTKLINFIKRIYTLPENTEKCIYCDFETIHKRGFKQHMTKVHAKPIIDEIETMLKHDFNIDWTPYLVKELLWKQLQEAMTGKTSTTQLTTKEVNQVYNQLTQILTSKFGVDVPFPSTEDDYGTENN